MEKPVEIEWIEKYICDERISGKSENEITEQIMHSFLYFIDKRVRRKLSDLDSLAISKLGRVFNSAVSEEVACLAQH